FAAIVDGDAETAPGYAKIHDIIYAAVQREYPDYGAIELGDPRVRTAAALKSLAFESFPGARVSITPVVLSLASEPETLAREAAGFFYASFVLSTPFHQQMLTDLATHFAGAKNNAAESRFALPVNQLVIQTNTTCQ
ncbi:MAG: hypothetical protein AAFR75_02755, partial [Pseudomonadota bacterium]